MPIFDFIHALLGPLLVFVGWLVATGLLMLVGVPRSDAAILGILPGIGLGIGAYVMYWRLLCRLFRPMSAGQIILLRQGEDLDQRVSEMLPEIQGEPVGLPGSLKLARSISDALDFAEGIRPSIILMDVRTEFGVSEVEAIQVLRADPATAAVPIALFLPTAETPDVDPVQEARQLGVDYVFRKPFPEAELKAVLQRCWDVATEGDPYAVRDLGD